MIRLGIGIVIGIVLATIGVQEAITLIDTGVETVKQTAESALNR